MSEEEVTSKDEELEASEEPTEEEAGKSPSIEESAKGEESALVRFFLKIAQVGNKLPDPLTLFVILGVIVILLSVIFDGTSAIVTQRDGSEKEMMVGSLLSVEGIRWMLTSAVDNFINFAPLGPVLAVMIGIGVAERTNFISMGLKILVRSVPPSFLTATLVFAGVMSSLVADAGYVVLTPLGAVLFAGLGRHPLVGLAAAFAGVSGGYSANLLITGLDPLLADLTMAAAKTVDPAYAANINPTCNYYFMVASVFLITVIGTAVTKYVVEPMLGTWDPADSDMEELPKQDAPTAEEKRAFGISIAVMGVVGGIIAAMTLIPGGPLMVDVPAGKPAVSGLAPLFDSIEVLITVLFIIPGVVYGILTGKVRNDRDVAKMASAAMAAMGAYIVLAFVAGQFVAYFNHTNLGTILAFNGAQFIKSLGLQSYVLLIAFIIISSIMNLFVGSASAKWAFMAPIFVPMLMLSGLSPELVQAGYRVGDSVTNIITPLMPYLPIIIVFAQKYDRKAGLGTLISAMLPYSIAFALGWSVLLAIWLGFDIPLGPGVSSFYEAVVAK
ncbi:MAG: AbgT family transporter [Myxococcota bacterium]|nr:AbgT family transporter [Myxococcota bacterium]